MKDLSEIKDLCTLTYRYGIWIAEGSLDQEQQV